MDKASLKALVRRQRHPELHMKETDIDRHNCERVVPMEVLSLGMPRTGTSAMKAALQILGYDDVYHMTNTWTNPRDIDMWMEAYDAAEHSSTTTRTQKRFGRAEWDQLLGHCMAVTDAPAISFSASLSAAYPASKIILVRRDLDAWHTSISRAIDAAFRRESVVLAWLDPLYAGRLHRLARRTVRVLFDGARSAPQAKANARAAFEAHYADVRALGLPAERLLEYELGSGWGPLCAFLGKEVPEVRFPEVSEEKLFADMAEGVSYRCMERALANAGIGFAVVLFVAWVVYMTRSYLWVGGLPDWRSEL